MPGLTYIAEDDLILQFTGCGPVSIDGQATLDALQASVDKCLEADPPRIFHARRLQALHAQLYELVAAQRRKPCAEIVQLRPVTETVRHPNPSAWL